MMIYFIIAGAVIVWAIDYMYLSGSDRMCVDFDSDLGDILLITFLSFVGIPFILPGLLFLGIMKCIFYFLDIARDCICTCWNEFARWINLSWSEKKERRREYKLEKEKIKETKKDETIKKLNKKILSLNIRINELNKYRREDIIDIDV